MIVEVVAGRHPRHRNAVHRDGHKNTGTVAANSGMKIFRRYANDGEGMTADEQCLANDISRCRKARLPVVIAENHDGIGVLFSFIRGGKESSCCRFQPQNLKRTPMPSWFSAMTTGRRAL